MIERNDGSISAFECSVVRAAFRSMVDAGLPECQWASVAESLVEDMTGQVSVDREILDHIISKPRW